MCCKKVIYTGVECYDNVKTILDYLANVERKIEKLELKVESLLENNSATFFKLSRIYLIENLDPKYHSIWRKKSNSSDIQSRIRHDKGLVSKLFAAFCEPGSNHEFKISSIGKSYAKKPRPLRYF